MTIMSNGLNKWMGIGRLCEKPEVRFTQGGQAVMNLRIATNDSYLDKDGVRKERVDYHSAVLWGKRAEGLARVLDKGMQVYVEGRMQTSSYEDREGVKKYKTECVINEVILLGSKGDHAAPDDGGGYDGGQPNDAPQRTQAPAQGGYAPRAAARPPQGGGQQRPPTRPQPPVAPPSDDYDGGGYGGGDDELPF